MSENTKRPPGRSSRLTPRISGSISAMSKIAIMQIAASNGRSPNARSPNARSADSSVASSTAYSIFPTAGDGRACAWAIISARKVRGDDLGAQRRPAAAA